MQAGLEALRPLRGHLLLRALPLERFVFESEDGLSATRDPYAVAFWSVAHRVDGESFAVEEYATRPEALERALPDLVESVALLAGVPRPPILQGCALTPGLQTQTYRRRRVLSYVALGDASLSSALGDALPGHEPSSPACLVHGDPILKNVVFGDRCRLVDWESIGVLPLHREFTHMAAHLWTLTHDHDVFARAIEAVWAHAAPLLELHMSAQEFRGSCFWHALNETSNFHALDTDLMVERASALLAGI
jgi:aminoglycoside phosphotransferase (APT) family kinase protein